jgi:hypothetical protein
MKWHPSWDTIIVLAMLTAYGIATAIAYVVIFHVL